jgi:hypothetical protein
MVCAETNEPMSRNRAAGARTFFITVSMGGDLLGA